MSEVRPIEIVGGGLAGLSLGLALRRSAIPTTVFEAGAYPRHRVCGEFITGLDPRTIDLLGLEPFLADARRHRRVAWFFRDRPMERHTLPSPALALSRHCLDDRLAQAFTGAGGQLFTHTRVDAAATPPGRVFAVGRRRAPSDWIGLKAHVRELALASELELHLGEHAYVGLCEVEDQAINVCGLFRRRGGITTTKETALVGYLAASGLESLAARVRTAKIDFCSCSAVAGLRFDRRPPASHRVMLGDAYAMIPPFTGNGMAMAFQSAADALDPLIAWSRGEADWAGTITTIQSRLRRRFRVRLASAAALHPCLLTPHWQRGLSLLSRVGILPIRPLYSALH